jgi:hypothetical protein
LHEIADGIILLIGNDELGEYDVRGCKRDEDELYENKNNVGLLFNRKIHFSVDKELPYIIFGWL